MTKRVILVMNEDELAHLLNHVQQPLSCPLTTSMVCALGASHENDGPWTVMATPGPIPWDEQDLPGGRPAALQAQHRPVRVAEDLRGRPRAQHVSVRLAHKPAQPFLPFLAPPRTLGRIIPGRQRDVPHPRPAVRSGTSPAGVGR